MNKAVLTKVFWITLLGFGISFPVNATVFAIDSFTVLRNGDVFFHDDFDDGDLPPDTGWTYPSEIPAVYSTVGEPGPENDSRLYLDTARGNLQNSEVTGNPLLVQRNRLRTNTNDDPNSGLKFNHDIAVFGVFDFIAPENNNERYSIRLTDFNTGYPAANDNVDVTVRRTEEGALTLAFREADFGTGQMNVLDQIFLTDQDFLDHEQIVMGLFSGPNSTEVYAGYSFLGGSGGDTNFTYFDNFGNIFEGEVWTRAAFIATQVPAAVPEPASLALMLAGLVGIRFARKRTG